LEIPATKRELIFGEHLIYGGVNLVENYPMNFDDLMKRVKRLNPRTIRIAGKRREKFARIAITSGQGFFGTFFDQLKPEVYIAGEFEQEAVKYAEDLGVMLVELTHQASECRPLDLIARSLEDKIGLPVVHIEIPDTITNIEIEEK
jgi:putative NIF3 family GTP cyclohydrolase 1 type 2